MVALPFGELRPSLGRFYTEGANFSPDPKGTDPRVKFLPDLLFGMFPNGHRAGPHTNVLIFGCLVEVLVLRPFLFHRERVERSLYVMQFYGCTFVRSSPRHNRSRCRVFLMTAASMPEDWGLKMQLRFSPSFSSYVILRREFALSFLSPQMVPRHNIFGE